MIFNSVLFVAEVIIEVQYRGFYGANLAKKWRYCIKGEFWDAINEHLSNK